MAKKSKNVEKETRRLMDAIGDLIKKKNNGEYKIKAKGKELKNVERSCPHWIFRKGKEVPMVKDDPAIPGNWKCKICKASFPIKPAKNEDYEDGVNLMLGFVNQMQFWSVKLGGNADDTKMFLQLRKALPKFAKTSKHILKAIDKRQKYENNKKKSDTLSQFDNYSGFGYR